MVYGFCFHVFRFVEKVSHRDKVRESVVSILVKIAVVKDIRIYMYIILYKYEYKCLKYFT